MTQNKIGIEETVCSSISSPETSKGGWKRRKSIAVFLFSSHHLHEFCKGKKEESYDIMETACADNAYTFLLS
jgi:hypothetical protein